MSNPGNNPEEDQMMSDAHQNLIAAVAADDSGEPPSRHVRLDPDGSTAPPRPLTPFERVGRTIRAVTDRNDAALFGEEWPSNRRCKLFLSTRTAQMKASSLVGQTPFPIPVPRLQRQAFCSRLLLSSSTRAGTIYAAKRSPGDDFSSHG